MALPKRRHSKARRDKRRTHQKLSLPPIEKCPNCGEVKLSHRVCLKCGYYHNEQILIIKTEKKK
jgi:large subunit ribosomal protein L32